MTSALDGIASGNVGSRVERVRARLADDFAAQAMLVSSATNIRYLTGFTGVSAGVLLLPGRLVLLADRRYRTLAQRIVSAPHMSQQGVEVMDPSQRSETIERSLLKSARMVIEEDNVTMSEYSQLATDLPDVELVPAGDVILKERLIKDAGEVAKIRAAGAISDAAVEDLIAATPLGWSELEIAAFLVEQMTALGAERAGFEPMVATGERSALVHSRPSRERLEEGMILLVDFGAEVDGYKADMTRALWWGELPRNVSAAVDAVEKAYDAAVGRLNPGASFESVDAAARAVLREHELEQFMIHPSGHNIGLEIHERPFFSKNYQGELAIGNVVTVEPGVYIPGTCGIRLEDTFVVTSSGPLALTSAPHRRQPASRDTDRPSRSTSDAAVADTADPSVRGFESQPGQHCADIEELDDHKRFLGGDRATWQASDPD